MKNKFILFLFLALNATTPAQFSQYEKGFAKGYKIGYCYQKVDCVEPVTPIAPVPNYNESSTSYQDGYNIGFLTGKSKSEAKNSANDNSNVVAKRMERNIDYWNDIEKTQNEIIQNKLKSMQQKSDIQSHVNSLTKKAAEYSKVGNSYLKNGDYATALDPIYNAYKYYLEISNYITDDRSHIYAFVGNSLCHYSFCQFMLSNSEGALQSLKVLDSSYLAYMSKNDINLFFLIYTRVLAELKMDADALSMVFRGLKYFPNDQSLSELKSKLLVKNRSEEINNLRNSTGKRTVSGEELWNEMYKNYNAKNYEETIGLAEELIKDNGDNAWYARFYKALANSKLQYYIESNDQYEYLIKNSGTLHVPSNFLGTIYNNIAYNHISMQKYEIASAYVSRALVLDQSKDYIWDTKGEVEYHLGNYNEGIIAMNKSISLSKRGNSFLYRGLSKIKLGKTVDGCSDLRTAVSLGDENGTAKLNQTVFCK